MAKIVFEKGDVFRTKSGKVGVVVNSVFVMVIDSIDSTGIHVSAESHPEKMELIPAEEVIGLPIEQQCIIKGIQGTLFFVTL